MSEQNGALPETMPGVSGMSLYLPAFRVWLADWCRWTQGCREKIEAQVGRSLRMPGPKESVYTMAASAVLQLIHAYDVDPGRIGFLALGTESSTDNSAGAIIVKGMVDRALREHGLPPIAHSCEVPELKHACLGGVYALKSAARYLALDGQQRVAVVVSADIALYARGSTGEPTQGAGAVAMLVEAQPRLFGLDLAHAGSASSYRGPDFRKPTRRTAPANGGSAAAARLLDYPVFNGKYSTFCYLDQTARAVDDLLAKLQRDPCEYLAELSALFFHRPYHAMPIQALASLTVWGLARSRHGHDRLRRLCAEAEVSYDELLAELGSAPKLFQEADGATLAQDPYPRTRRVARHHARAEEFQQVVKQKMSLGSEGMRDLGNLYTAALPAWIALGLEQALTLGLPLEGRQALAIGYGSGDAAEAIPLRVMPGWQDAAARIGSAHALAGAIDLDQEQYEALHAGDEPPGLPDDRLRDRFIVERIGTAEQPDFQDVGLEYYRYERGAELTREAR